MKYIALDMDFFSGNNCMLALEKEAARFAEDQISVIMLTEKMRKEKRENESSIVRSSCGHEMRVFKIADPRGKICFFHMTGLRMQD